MTASDVRDKVEQFLKDLLADPNLGENVNLKIARYSIVETDLLSEVSNWCLQYLAYKKCPRQLLSVIVSRAAQKTDAFLENDLLTNGLYDSSKVTQLLISIVEEICKSLLNDDRETIETVSNWAGLPVTSECSDRNRRRTNEDRLISIPDLAATYGKKYPHQIGFYGVFDGHGGVFAATYSAVHLPYHLATNLVAAENEDRLAILADSFSRTETGFAKKCEDQKVRGGSTAVCMIYEREQQRLHVSWAGDSKALLVREGQLTQIVRPHIPTDPKESQRITDQGGSLMYWGGVLRVNGALAVSRSIGDFPHKPYISGEPETEIINLDGKEDFIVLSSDGLWDVVTEENIANTIYMALKDDANEAETVAEKLVNCAKNIGASDNITVIVVFLKDPEKIAQQVQNGTIPVTIDSTS